MLFCSSIVLFFILYMPKFTRNLLHISNNLLSFESGGLRSPDDDPTGVPLLHPTPQLSELSDVYTMLTQVQNTSLASENNVVKCASILIIISLL